MLANWVYIIQQLVIKGYEKNNLLDFVKSYKIDNPDDMYAEMARDNVHRGNAYNTYWANFIYNKYLETL